MVELLLLEILSARHGFDDIAELVKCVHDHIGARGLQQTGLRECHAHVDGLHARLLRLLDDILVDVCELDGDLVFRRCCGSRSRRCRGLIRLRDRTEFLDEVGDIDDILCLAVADAIDHLSERIDALEERVDDILVELELFLADEVEYILHLMRELSDLVEAHRRRHAFERMRVTENLIDDGGILHIVLKAQESIVERLQMLVRLVEEHVHVLIRIHICTPPKFIVRLRQQSHVRCQ